MRLQEGGPHDETKATSVILNESVSSLSFYLQEMDVNRIHDVETEALAAKCRMVRCW